jgi:2-phosphosulfolactate phosphatase
MHWFCHDVFHRMPPAALAGGIAVVIDVLRASTTMTTALANGAAGVWPVAAVDEARALAARLGPTTLLGGERGGVRVPGFDLGNSPLEYTAAVVAGRPVVITTTNGTAAIAACAAAADVLVGTLANRRQVAAAARRLSAARGSAAVHLVCAGTDGALSAEDVLAAGAMLDAAAAHPGAASDELDPAAWAAREAFRRPAATADVAAALVEAFHRSPGGANLVALGMGVDLEVCARLDVLPVVGRLDRASGCLRAMREELPTAVRDRPPAGGRN